MTIQSQLETMTGAELVGLYNKNCVKLKNPLPPVKKFTDKETAVRRVANLLNDVEAQKPAANSNKERKVRRKYFNFVGDETPKPYTPDMSKLRGRLFVELKKPEGMTFERAMEIVREFDKDRGKEPFNVERRAYEGTRLIHYYLGYGLKQDENEVIFLVEGRK